MKSTLDAETPDVHVLKYHRLPEDPPRSFPQNSLTLDTEHVIAMIDGGFCGLRSDCCLSGEQINYDVKADVYYLLLPNTYIERGQTEQACIPKKNEPL